MPRATLIISGGLAPDSILKTEFGLEDLFSLRIGPFFYRTLIEEQLSSLKDEYEIKWDSGNQPDRDAIIYDAHCYIKNSATLANEVRKKKSGTLQFKADDFINFRDNDLLFTFLLLKSPHRNFNEFTIKDNYVLKKCSFEKKGQREYNFLSQIPQEIQKYFPRVKNYLETPLSQQYEVEMVRIFDFGRICMHGQINIQVFKDLLNEIETYMKLSPRVEVGARRFRQHLENLFVDKLKSRVDEFRTNSAGRRLGDELQLFSKAEEVIELLRKKIVEIQAQPLTINHGDMCFSNILYGTQNKTLKFIDPRGVNSREEMYGPFYYDLAKLSHSVFGQYDLIINDVHRDNRINTLFSSIQKTFTEWVINHGWDLEFIRLCEASLFFSMLPFHVNRLDHARLQIQSGLRALEAVKK